MLHNETRLLVLVFMLTIHHRSKLKIAVLTFFTRHFMNKHTFRDAPSHRLPPLSRYEIRNRRFVYSQSSTKI